MKNATLVINNSKKFVNDVWQLDESHDTEWWKKAIESFADTLQEIYDNSEEIPSDRLYILGDVINLLANIDVEVTL